MSRSTAARTRERCDAPYWMLRAFGEIGWRSGTVPAGGYRFPLANEGDFDWRLIGARRGTCKIDGEEREGVWHAGLFYSRRELAEQDRKRLVAAP